MNESAFDMNEFINRETPLPPEEPPVEAEEKADEQPETEAPELDVQKEVVAALAADKAEMDATIARLTTENDGLKKQMAEARSQIESLKSELARKEGALAAQMEKEFDLQERNPNALALLDREIEVPDRFPGETRDHVLEVIAAARESAESEGRLRKAQLLEAVLMANQPNGRLAKLRGELAKLFADNNNLINGPVLDELKKRGISHKNGEDYLLPSEILKRTY